MYVNQLSGTSNSARECVYFKYLCVYTMYIQYWKIIDDERMFTGDSTYSTNYLYIRAAGRDLMIGGRDLRAGGRTIKAAWRCALLFRTRGNTTFV